MNNLFDWCLEPESNRHARYERKRRILSPLCLPIPPSRLSSFAFKHTKPGNLEAQAGVEPTYSDLQSGT
jgi:hypothetical protein